MNNNKKWTKETCFIESQKYKTRGEFKEGSGSAYNVALRNNWIDDYVWLEEKKKPKDYWNYDTCYEEAKNYKSRSDFNKGNGSAYAAAIRNHWLDEYYWFKQPQKQKQNGYWENYDNCYAEARKYESRYEFMKRNQSAYQVARKNKWLDSFTWLKDQRFDLITDKIDCVYVYEFKEYNTAYIGRTLIRSQKRRDKEHIFRLDSVSSFAKEHDIAVPPMKILETNLTIKEGAKQEGYWLKKYQEDGWITLNKAKTGSIGAIAKGKWNYNTCYNLAKKCKMKSEMKSKNQRAYIIALKNKWFGDYYWFLSDDEIRHKERPWRVIWNKERCFEEARKYHSRGEFRKCNGSAYQIARRNKWLDEFFPF